MPSRELRSIEADSISARSARSLRVSEPECEPAPTQHGNFGTENDVEVSFCCADENNLQVAYARTCNRFLSAY